MRNRTPSRSQVPQWLKDLLGWRYIDYALLGALVLVVCGANLVWRQMDLRPPHWDMARHLWNSLTYFDLFSTHKHVLLTVYTYYPPLIYWTAIPFYLLLKPSIESAVASNIVYVAMLVFSIYGLGRTLWNRTVGLLAAVFIIATPMMVSQFKEYQLDAPLTAVVALGLFLLVKSRAFSARSYSIGFGIAFGLGLLAKWTYPFLIALPLAYAIIEAVVAVVRGREWYRMLNMVQAAVYVFAIAGTWYVVNYTQIKIDLLANGVQAGLREGDPLVGTAASNIWYLRVFIDQQMYLIPFLLFVGGLIWGARRWEDLRRNIYPILLMVGVFGFFTFLQNKDARYTLPALVGVAIIAASLVQTAGAAGLRKVLRIGIVGYSALAFWLISFGVPWLSSDYVINSKGTLPVVAFAQHGYIIGPPSRENWHLEQAFQKMAQVKPMGSLTYSAGADTLWSNWWDVAYYSSLYHLTMSAPGKESDFILVREAKPPLNCSCHQILARDLPDGTRLELYRHDLENIE